MKKDAYHNSSIIIYPQGDRSLERKRIIHREDVNDKAYTIKEKDTLTYIATKFYGEPLHWYLIADANEIENPLQLEVGLTIIIPNINRYGL